MSSSFSVGGGEGEGGGRSRERLGDELRNGGDVEMAIGADKILVK